MAASLSRQLRCRPCGVRTHSAVSRWFPTPTMTAMSGAGIDISDSSVKWVSLVPQHMRGWKVSECGQRTLPDDAVVDGIVRDSDKLAAELRAMSDDAGSIPFAHAALPEEAAFVFSMDVPDVRDHGQVMHMIEFELEGRVPLRAAQSVYDYDIVALHADGRGAEIGVTVFAADIVAGYVDAFAASGITLLSLELEARSIARAVVPVGHNGVALLADFGRARAGIAIIKNQIPIFTSTVSVGGDTLTRVIREKLSGSEEDAEQYKNTHGLQRNGDEEVYNAMIVTANAFADEIARHYQYWDTRRNERGDRVTPVTRVLLAGGSANLRGLPEYIAARIQAPTERVAIWENVCSFEDYIPPIDRHHSLGYATSVGLALRST